MRLKVFAAVLVCLFASVSFAQSITSSTANHVRTGASLPTSCGPGDVFYKTSVTAGLYNATGSCVWALVGAGGVTFANPSALVGLSAMNGSAMTAMRSDAAPALNQSIAPTWTGQHTFSGNSVKVQPTTSAIGLLPGLVWATELADPVAAIKSVRLADGGLPPFVKTDIVFQPGSFTSGPVEQARLTNDGKFGIGTSSPTNLLTVTTASVDTTIASLEFSPTDADRHFDVDFVNTTNGRTIGGKIRVTDPSGGPAFAHSMGFFANPGGGAGTSPVEYLHINYNGHIFMPNLTTSSGLQSGIVCVGTAGELINESVACLSSSARWKHGITPMVHGWDWLSQMKPVSWAWNDEKQRQPTMGVGTAENLAAIDPSLAAFDDGGQPYTINDRGVLGVLVNTIKELHAEVEALKEQLRK